MEPTVLAGAIEFSPAEIALIVAVLVAAFVVVTAPGWLVLSIVLGRRAAPGATPGRRWAARVGGAFAGLAVCVAVGSLVNGVLAGSPGGASPILAVLGGWGACWALAGLLRRPAPAATPTVPGPPTATGQGWGR